MAMATYTSNPSAGLLSRVAPFLHALAERIERRQQYLETLTELETLSERELADLGLSRHDIPRVAREATGYGS